MWLFMLRFNQSTLGATEFWEQTHRKPVGKIWDYKVSLFRMYLSFEYTNHLNLENETLTQVFFWNLQCDGLRGKCNSRVLCEIWWCSSIWNIKLSYNTLKCFIWLCSFYLFFFRTIATSLIGLIIKTNLQIGI